MTGPARLFIEDRVLGNGGLSRRSRAASRALAETLFTTREGPPPKERLDWLCDDLDDWLRQAGPRARSIYELCLFGISSMAPTLIGRRPPFRALSLEARVEALEAMEKSPLGLAIFGAKAILCILYYEHPDAASAVEHDGRCMHSEAQREAAE